MNRCYTCELTARRKTGTAPLWDNIYNSTHWDVVHAYNTSLPGWLVLVLQRHSEAIADLTEDEAAELGPLLRQVSLALHTVTDCAKTYIIQFAEAAEHPHVHFHVIPRMTDQPLDRRSTKIFGYLGVDEEERVSEEKMNELAAKIRQILS